MNYALRLDIQRDFYWPSWLRHHLRNRLSKRGRFENRIVHRFPF